MQTSELESNLQLALYCRLIVWLMTNRQSAILSMIICLTSANHVAKLGHTLRADLLKQVEERPPGVTSAFELHVRQREGIRALSERGRPPKLLLQLRNWGWLSRLNPRDCHR